MSSTTGFFGLQKLQSGDALSTNDYAFTNRNIDVIDRLLGKLDDAVFENDTPLDDPTDTLSLEVVATGGLIPAGRTVRYKYTYVDAFGNESAASPEATVGTDAPITRPSAAGLEAAATGGTLLAGNYFYILSAYADVNTNETSGSPAASLQIRTGSTNKITLTLPSLPSGADGFNIFRRGPGEVQFYYLDTVDMTVATPPSTYEDDNSITVTNSRTPSATNLTNSTNLINVTLPGATPFVPDGYTWKLYRTFVSGDYNSSLLEWVVTEVDDVIVPYAVDSGLRTTIGIPPATSSLTGATSRIATLEDEVVEINLTLGTNPQAGFADIAERLDDIDVRASAWTSVFSEDFETDPVLSTVFTDNVNIAVVNSAGDGDDGSDYYLSTDTTGFVDGYVEKVNTTADGSSVAVEFSFLVTSAAETKILTIDNSNTNPSDFDGVHISIEPSPYNLSSFLIRADAYVDGIDDSTSTYGYDVGEIGEWTDIRVEIDWANGPADKPTLRVYVDQVRVLSLFPWVNKLVTVPLGVIKIGAMNPSVEAVYLFDSIYIESKTAIDPDRVDRELVSWTAIKSEISPFNFYSKVLGKSVIDVGYDTTLVSEDYEDFYLFNTNIIGNFVALKFEGQIFYDAPTAEDLKIVFTSLTDEATPIAGGLFNVQITPEAVPGKVYVEDEDIVVDGAGAGVLRGVSFLGSFISGLPDQSMVISVKLAQNSTPATPVGTIIKAGTWIKVSHLNDLVGG